MWNEKENKLEDIWFMGGEDEVICFSVKDKQGEVLDLTGSVATWTLCDIGCKESPIIVKTMSNGIKINKSDCVVSISSADTLYLQSNRYEHELIITQANGKVLRPCYGYIQIRKASEF